MKLIVCGPVPFGGTPVIHAGTPLLVQPQPAAVFTANELAPPPAGGLWLAGASETLHPPVWLTAKLWPPMMMAALRSGPGFGATENAIAWVPVPLGGMPVTQVGTSLVFHVQTAFVEIVTVSCPPPAANVWPAGEIE
jgi:hypothetical protein